MEPNTKNQTVIGFDKPGVLGLNEPISNIQVGFQQNQLPDVAPAAVPISKRGVFSEYLLRKTERKRAEYDGDDGQFANIVSVPLYAAVSQFPTTRSFRRPDKKRDSVKTDSEVKKSDEKKPYHNRTKIQIHYRKALEPKVMQPFASRPGETPRKIEIERRKRIYSSKKIDSLIISEINALKKARLLRTNPFSDFGDDSTPAKAAKVHAATIDAENTGTKSDGGASSNKSAAGASNESKVDADLSHLLPLDVFDDTEFDSRTVDDWLDMSVIPDDYSVEFFEKVASMPHRRGIVRPEAPQIRYAVHPLPAKAFNGSEWRDCVVVAYDDLTNKWKIKWRSFDGWTLDRKSDDVRPDILDPEDEAICEELDRKLQEPRAVTEKDAWMHRYELILMF